MTTAWVKNKDILNYLENRQKFLNKRVFKDEEIKNINGKFVCLKEPKSLPSLIQDIFSPPSLSGPPKKYGDFREGELYYGIEIVDDYGDPSWRIKDETGKYFSVSENNFKLLETNSAAFILEADDG